MKSWISSRRPERLLRKQRAYGAVSMPVPRVLRFLKVMVWCVVLSLLLFTSHRFLRIRDVDCISAPSCTETDWQIVRSLQGKLIISNLSLSQPGKIYTIRRRSLRRVSVEVQNLSVFARVYADTSLTTKHIILSDGTLYLGAEENLPPQGSEQVTLIDERLGGTAPMTVLPEAWMPHYQQLLSQGRALGAERIVIKSATEVTLQFSDGLVAIITLAQMDEQLRSLQLLLSSPTIESRPAQVDLRFAHPVLRTF